MTEALRFGFLVGANVYALWKVKSPLSVWLFLAGNLVYELLTEAAYLNHWHYPAVYAATTILWLFFAFHVVWESLLLFSYRLRLLAIPAVLTVGMSRLCFMGVDHPWSQSSWIVLLQGSVLLFLGQVLGASSAYSPRHCNQFFILSMTWLAQTLFLCGYLLHDSWLGLYWLPAVIVGCGFIAVGRTSA